MFIRQYGPDAKSDHEISAESKNKGLIFIGIALIGSLVGGALVLGYGGELYKYNSILGWSLIGLSVSIPGLLGAAELGLGRRIAEAYKQSDWTCNGCGEHRDALENTCPNCWRNTIR